jgi:ABC-type transporter Mla MlaB component
MDDGAAVCGKFIVEGALTIRTADAALQRLRDLLEQHSAIEIDTSRVGELDVSGIQLILAACASAGNAGKTITIAQPLSEAVHAVLVQGGFLDAGDAGGATQSFWLGGKAGWRKPY